MSLTETTTRWRVAAALIATLSIYSATVGLTVPLLSLILESRGVGRTLNGLNAAMPAVGMVLASPWVPRAIARFGIRRFLLGCMAGEALTLLALPLFDSLPAWFAIRLLMGMTMAGLFIAAESWLNEIAAEATRGRVMAAYMMVMSAGFAFGPAVIALTGVEGWLPFMVAVALIGVAAVPLFFVQGIAMHLGGTPGFGTLAFLRVAPVLCAAWLLVSFKEGAAMPLLPVYGSRIGLGAGDAALMLTVMGAGAIALQLPIGWLADRYDRRRVLLAAVAGSLIGPLLLPLTVGGGWLFWGFLFAWGGIASGIAPLSLALLGQRFRGPDLVTANAAFGLLWGIGSIVGPTLAGPAMDAWDPHGLPAVLAAGAAACLLVAALRWWMDGRGRR